MICYASRLQWIMATVHKELGELEEAKRLLLMASEALFKKLGPEHRYTKRVASHLAAVEKQLQ